MALPLSAKLSTKTGIIVGIFFLLVFVGGGYYLYLQYQNTQKMLQAPQESIKAEVAEVVAIVGKLIVLPSDDEPTLALVSDKTKLQTQAFFAGVQNGDMLLIYPKTKKAFVYRPSIQKLVDVVSVNIGEQVNNQPVNIPLTPSVSPTAKPTGKAIVTPTITPTPTSAFQKVNVALYNGTKTAGLAAKTQTTLTTKAPFVTVVAKGNSTSNYTETLIIDFTGKYKKEAAELVKVLGGTTGVLPKGEVKPTADILVILGPQ